MAARHDGSNGRAMFSAALLLALLGLLVAMLVPAESDAAARIRRLAASGELEALAGALDADMIVIPGGAFVMGSDAHAPDERPQRSITLSAFAIDRFEVTNAQYWRFVLATGHSPPPYWPGDIYPTGQADAPVVAVGWDEATAYCQWAGKRLPTEAEWERACRGTQASLYPWGNAWEPARANVDPTDWVSLGAPARPGGPSIWDEARQLLATPGAPGLRPVGSYAAGASAEGVHDLAGNASEWVADAYNWAGYWELPHHDPLNTQPPYNHVVRGSAWFEPVALQGWLEASSRCSARSSSHAAYDPRIGFRCARSLP